MSSLANCGVIRGTRYSTLSFLDIFDAIDIPKKDPRQSDDILGHSIIFKIIFTFKFCFVISLLRTWWTRVGLGRLTGDLKGKKRQGTFYLQLQGLTCEWQSFSKGSLTVKLWRFCCAESKQEALTCFQNKKQLIRFREGGASSFEAIIIALR